MRILLNAIPEVLMESMAWTLFHSIWQGLIIFLLAVGVIWVFRVVSAAKRYNVMLLSMGLFVFLVASTFAFHYSTIPSDTHAVEHNGEVTYFLIQQFDKVTSVDTSLTFFVSQNFVNTFSLKVWAVSPKTIGFKK